MPVKTKPDGYQSVVPYLYIRDAAKALDFYTKALGAKEMFRMPGPDGKIGHAEMRIGDSVIMLADEFPEMGARSPLAYGGTPMCIHLYVDDVDAQTSLAVAAGAKIVRPVKDQFYGDRSGIVEDPFGHVWNIATHKEDLTPEQIDQRHKEFMQQMQQQQQKKS